jgi:hypothetical protein
MHFPGTEVVYLFALIYGCPYFGSLRPLPGEKTVKWWQAVRKAEK